MISSQNSDFVTLRNDKNQAKMVDFNLLEKYRIEVITLNEKVITTIACRVLSIYTVIKGLERSFYLFGIPFITDQLDKNTLINILFIYVVPSILIIVMGVLLWLMAPRISERMIPSRNDREINKIDLDIIELQSAAFSVVGLVVLIRLIPDIFNIVPQIAQLSGDFIPTGTVFRLEIKISIIRTFIKLIIGLLLLFKSSGIVGVVKNLRKVGLKDIE